MSTNNIGFYEDLTKVIFQFSSNTHLISSSECYATAITIGICYEEGLVAARWIVKGIC